MGNPAKSYTSLQKFLAYSVHAFTSLGAVAGFFAIVYIGKHEFEHAAMFLAAAFIIDGIDGTFARLFKVREVLPHMEGKNIDFVVDFANYALIPVWFMYEAGWYVGDSYHYLLPEEWRWLAVSCILVSSALYYAKEGMVSSDHYFIGFPVLWNVVVFYTFYIFGLSPWMNFALILFLCVAQFFPVKFLYPSRSPHFRALNIIFSLLIVVANFSYLFLLRDPFWNPLLQWVSLISLIYFILMSFYITFFIKEEVPEATKPSP